MKKGAKKVEDVKVVLGRLIRVENLNRPKFSNADKTYVAVQVEESDGKKEYCLLFTEEDIQKAKRRAEKNQEDLTEKGFFTDLLD